MNEYIQELTDVIKKAHGVEAVHVGSVEVKEVFQGNLIWDGVVEVFDLNGHPEANRVYAWAHNTDNPRGRRHVTVLHIPPVVSAQTAVQAAIVQEYKNRGTSKEN